MLNQTLPYTARLSPRLSPRIGLVAFALLHVPLALVLQTSPTLALIHALLTFGLGLYWALTNTPPERVACIGAYICGAEVLWRMMNAPIFWESGKYATCAIFLVALVRMRQTRIPALPLVYFVALLPALPLTLAGMDPGRAQQQISFNLSGPLAVLISAWFFSSIRLTRAGAQRLMIWLLAPVVSIALIATLGTLASRGILWQNDSLLATSGGYGPNQVSAALGLALLMVWLALIFLRADGLLALTLGLLGLWFLGQGMLTFSRGGIFNALIAGLAINTVGMLRRGHRVRALALLIVGLFAFLYILFPGLDIFTGGALERRFTETTLTNRDVIMLADLEIFAANPLFGVGPGMAQQFRADQLNDLNDLVAAHTEYTRLLAEHGLLGGLAMGMLFLLCWHNFRRTRNQPINQGIVIAAGVWALVFMAHSAMRLVAPSFMLGLTYLTLTEDNAP